MTLLDFLAFLILIRPHFTGKKKLEKESGLGFPLDLAELLPSPKQARKSSHLQQNRKEVCHKKKKEVLQASQTR